MKRINKFIALVLTMLIIISSFSTAAYGQALTISEIEQSLKIAIIPDIHVIPQSMWSSCACATAAVISDRRMTAESEAIFQAVVAEIISQAPDVVLIPGDLTRNGEYYAHRFVADKLTQLQMELPDATILVINGDHDINNPSAMDFSACPAATTETVAPAQFKEIYTGFGFGNPNNVYFASALNQAGGLSYVARPVDGFTIIAIDTNRYIPIRESGGGISAELLTWLLDQAREAQDRGDTVITFMHHNLLPHFSLQPELMQDWLIDDFSAIAAAFADGGIRYVFTGNLHAQSIAELTTPNGNTVFDIQTGSAIAYPSPVRYATFTQTVVGGVVMDREVDIRTTFLTEIDFICPITSERIIDLQQYGWDNSLNREMLDGLVNELLGDDVLNISGVIQELLDVEFTNTRGATHTGLRAIVESSLLTQDQYGNPLSNDAADLVMDALRMGLPMDLDGLVTVLDQPAQNRFRMNALGGVGGVSITYANMRVHLVDSIFNQFNNLLRDEDFINGLLDRMLAGIIDMVVYADYENEYSIFDFIQYVYLSSMGGDAVSEPWVDAIIAGFEYGSITSKMADHMVGLLLPELNDLLNSVTINTGALITADTGFAAITSIPLRLLVLALLGDPANLGGLLSTFGMDIEDLLGDAGGDLIPDDVLDDLGGMVVDLAVSLLAGSGSEHSDNNTVLRWSRDHQALGYIRFHLDGSGRDRGYYFAVPVMLCEIDENLMRIVEDSYEWQEVLVIGNIYGYREAFGRPNEMRGLDCPVPELEIGWEGGLNYAGAFWGWFEAKCLDPRLNGRANPASAFHISRDGDGEPMRWRPAIGTELRQVHPGTATAAPLYAMVEASGIDLDELLEHGFPKAAFNDGSLDFFGIWIRWGDIDDDGVTFNSDAALFNTYINTLALVLWGIPMDLPPIHHGAGNITLRGYTFNDGAARLNNFVNDLALILWGIPLENPTRLGTARPLGTPIPDCGRQ